MDAQNKILLIVNVGSSFVQIESENKPEHNGFDFRESNVAGNWLISPFSSITKLNNQWKFVFPLLDPVLNLIKEKQSNENTDIVLVLTDQSDVEENNIRKHDTKNAGEIIKKHVTGSDSCKTAFNFLDDIVFTKNIVKKDNNIEALRTGFNAINFSSYVNVYCFLTAGATQMRESVADMAYRYTDGNAKLIEKPENKDAFISDEIMVSKELLTEEAKKAAFAQLTNITQAHNSKHIDINSWERCTPEQIKVHRNFLHADKLYCASVSTEISNYDMEHTLEAIAKHFNKHEIIKKYISGYTDKVIDEFVAEGDMKTEKLAIPGGLVGLQALFIIVLNIARNNFKHDGQYNHLKIKMKLTEELSLKSHYCLHISLAGKKENGNSDKNIKMPKKVYDDIRKQKITATLLKPGSLKLQNTGKGFLEMRGAACFLNNIPINEIDEYEIEGKKVLSIHSDATGENECNFEYRLLVKKHFDTAVSNDACKELKNNEILKSLKLKRIALDTDQPVRDEYLIVTAEEKKSIQTGYRFPSKIITCEDIAKNPDIKDLSILWAREKIKNYLLPDSVKGGFNGTIPCFKFENGLKKDSSENKNSICKDKIIYYANHSDNIGCEKYCFYEKYSNSVNSEFYTLFTNGNDAFYALAMAYALQKVLIVEEGLVRYMKENKETYPHERALIFLPETDINKTGDTELKSKIIQEINKHDYDFVILHLGLIERFLEEKTEPNVRAWINENITQKEKLIITSSRAVTDTVPDILRFVNYVDLKKFLIDEPSKFLLLNLFYKLRSKK